LQTFIVLIRIPDFPISLFPEFPTSPLPTPYPYALFSFPSHPRQSRRRTRGHHRDGGRAGFPCGTLRRRADRSAPWLEDAEGGKQRSDMRRGTQSGRGSGTDTGPADLPRHAIRGGRTEGTDSVPAQTRGALLMRGTGNAGAVLTETSDTLVVCRTRNTGTVPTVLASLAVPIGEADGTDAVAAERCGTLRILRAGGAPAHQTQIGEALVVAGAR